MIDDFAWADADYDLAWTVAVISGKPVADVLAGYRRVGDLGAMTFARALAWRDEHLETDGDGAVQVHEVDGQVLAIEPNGWIGTEDDTLVSVSDGGAKFFAVYWSPVATRILQADDGRITGRFEPALIGTPGGASDLLPGWVEPEDFPIEHLNSACLAAMARRTGVAFDPGWFELELPTYRIAGG